MKAALVTGASGFIGQHLVQRLLKDSYRVRVLARASSSSRVWPAAVEAAEWDIRDAAKMKEAVAGCETVFHLAARVHAEADRRRDEALYHAVNVEGTRNVLEGAVTAGARRFVLFSSVKAMGEGGSRCLDESFGGPPETPYGRSKLEAERLVLDYGERGGLHTVSLRLPLVYGPGNKGNLFRMIAAIDRGFFPPLPPVRNRRSMVHVMNVVEAALLAATSPSANGQCYIVTDGQPYLTRELYEMICHGLGKRIPQWSIPIGILRVLGYMGDAAGRVRGRRFVFDSDALDKLIGSAWYSAEKISRHLGYRPSMTFQEALPELIAWYRKGQV